MTAKPATVETPTSAGAKDTAARLRPGRRTFDGKSAENAREIPSGFQSPWGSIRVHREVAGEGRVFTRVFLPVRAVCGLRAKFVRNPCETVHGAHPTPLPGMGPGGALCFPSISRRNPVTGPSLVSVGADGLMDCCGDKQGADFAQWADHEIGVQDGIESRTGYARKAVNRDRGALLVAVLARRDVATGGPERRPGPACP